ncbi:hypothetical protein ACLX1H_006140 [Fusarium chlamydosporum]
MAETRVPIQVPGWPRITPGSGDELRRYNRFAFAFCQKKHSPSDLEVSVWQYIAQHHLRNLDRFCRYLISTQAGNRFWAHVVAYRTFHPVEHYTNERAHFTARILQHWFPNSDISDIFFNENGPVLAPPQLNLLPRNDGRIYRYLPPGNGATQTNSPVVSSEAEANIEDMIDLALIDFAIIPPTRDHTNPLPPADADVEADDSFSDGLEKTRDDFGEVMDSWCLDYRSDHLLFQ